MCSLHVLFHITLVDETLTAIVTLEGSFPCVRPQMLFQLVPIEIRLGTNVTILLDPLFGFLAATYPVHPKQVNVQALLVLVTLQAVLALERHEINVRFHMPVQH